MEENINMAKNQSQVIDEKLAKLEVYKITKNRISEKTYYIITTILIIVAILALWSAYANRVFLTSEIEGYSMLPTINTTAPNNTISWDKVYINKYSKGKNGDIVVAWWTKLQEIDVTKTSVIKRIIACEGDTLAIDNSGDVTKVIVNGKIIEEPYIKRDGGGLKFSGFSVDLLSKWGDEITTGANGLNVLTIPKGYVFYMGDNRNGSADCRADGPRPLNQVIGKVEYIYKAKVTEDNALTDKIFVGESKDWWDRYWFGMGQVASYCFNWFIRLF